MEEVSKVESEGYRYALRYEELASGMAGFTGLIETIQGLLVGYSLATGEIWQCSDIETTRAIAKRSFHEVVEMVQAWGYEQ